MATYYSSPGSERESQDMYSRDPGGASYPMSSALGNLLYLNNPSSGPYTEFSGILQTQQNFMEMPAHGHHSAMSQDSSARESQDMLASHHGQRSFGHVKDMKNEMLMHMMDGAQSGGAELIHDDPHNGAQFEFGVLNNHDSSDVPVGQGQGQGQGLSLSLNTQILAPSLPYWSIKPDMLTPNSYQESLRIDDIRMKNMQSEASRAIRHSRYLKAAQEVLDEVVNVWKNIKQKAQKEQAEPGKADGKETDGGPKSEGASQESGANAAPELSTAEKQELQNKMAKLMAMLDEVDRKYKHYYHQMQNVVASFDMVAGPGSAKPYTAVALQTISRHFRCLKDAINDQINAIRKKLGEEENPSSKEGKLTRLRYIDQQLRQQRAFQQYGMIPQNAWRPQRGLPENSVTVLRAWLFEHFLHPYPKDSEKLMLARQTGLTRSQISNWFINARVRLWKPMIEDMYKEETGDLEQDSNSSSDNVPRSKSKVASSEENEDLKNARARVCETSQLSESRASMGTMNVGGAPVSFQNEPNPDDSFMNLMMKDQRSGEADGGLLLHNAGAQHSDESARFMAYHLAELGRYGNGNVSLTLGLQHSGSGLSVPNAQANFAGVGDDDIYNAGAPLGVSIASSDYESLNQMDQRQRFEQSPLLHDFVA
ncbi:BEL1-like homeodomain protein 7 [Triticum dicoccoides]|uniref:BEL1-like homeodomain protein 7 n=1 Tax=Triticum dicoccoides TaxID=85692 RepID=UPI000E7CB395|nr:BEL1-like homeodomain protein 7 [Triticum dicoccoides]XP_037438982.1 BEL1-like homeodomain protein 7 [Triticum dicoccoides]XP_037438983.1 BEL1-like homeodomain protein 7 [Triticum dicoccoides]XP_037438984.1 BEL1-like homeodomain protein 7 [Triticum dicoccoides]